MSIKITKSKESPLGIKINGKTIEEFCTEQAKNIERTVGYNTANYKTLQPLYNGESTSVDFSVHKFFHDTSSRIVEEKFIVTLGSKEFELYEIGINDIIHIAQIIDYYAHKLSDASIPDETREKYESIISKCINIIKKDKIKSDPKTLVGGEEKLNEIEKQCLVFELNKKLPANYRNLSLIDNPEEYIKNLIALAQTGKKRNSIFDEEVEDEEYNSSFYEFAIKIAKERIAELRGESSQKQK